MYGDNAYGTGDFQQFLERNEITSRCKTQPPTAPQGRFSKDRFRIDLAAGTVTCPNDVTVPIRRHPDGSGTAGFAKHCADCPLRSECTTSKSGRDVTIGVHEAVLTRARTRQRATEWRTDYRATRPKVERKFGHLMRRKHGGRNARVRGTIKVDADFNLLAAAHNLTRLARLTVTFTPTGWQTS